MTVAAGGGTMSGMLDTSATRVGGKEGSRSRRGRNMAELDRNQNRTLNQDRV